MSGRIKIREHLGWAWRLSIGLLRPILMLITKREWVGVERLPPQGGVIVTPNHHSHIDPLTFAHCLVDNGRLPRFLAKDSLFTVPLVRQILVATGQVPVHRLTSDAASAFHGAVQAVQDGKIVVVYPGGDDHPGRRPVADGRQDRRRTHRAGIRGRRRSRSPSGAHRTCSTRTPSGPRSCRARPCTFASGRPSRSTTCAAVR